MLSTNQKKTIAGARRLAHCMSHQDGIAAGKSGCVPTKGKKHLPNSNDAYIQKNIDATKELYQTLLAEYIKLVDAIDMSKYVDYKQKHFDMILEAFMIEANLKVSRKFHELIKNKNFTN